MNFEIPGDKERGLIWKFVGQPSDGAEVSLEERRPLDISCERNTALRMSQMKDDVTVMMKTILRIISSWILYWLIWFNSRLSGFRLHHETHKAVDQMAAANIPDDSSENMTESDNVAADSSMIREPRDFEPMKMYTPPIGPKEDKYKMNNLRRGKAIILNHEKFQDHRKTERQGTSADVTILKQRLHKLKFEVETHNDLPLNELYSQLAEVSKQDHKEEDCILIAVLTHGTNESGKDRLSAYDLDYDVDTLWSYFTANQCPSLAGKPKIFIIQACRGDEMSKQLPFKSAIQIDSAKEKDSNTSHRYSIPVEADILIAFSTFEGHVALRNTLEGSWFIQELCAELEDNSESLDLLSMLTNVKSHKQMPVIQSTLTRKVYLKSTFEDQQNNTVDLNAALEETNEKLSQITNILGNTGSSMAQKSRPKRYIASSKWNQLQTPLQPIDIPLPPVDVVFKHSLFLQTFLEEDPLNLSSAIKENGTLILNLLSYWENMKEEMKEYAYKNLVIFLNENARNWKMYKFCDDIPNCNVQLHHCHRRCTQSDVTDSGRIRKYSSIPKKRLTKKI
ncbi:hypothetical protein L9F63_011874 [Diploptera punctata]|uniref:Caspase-3 n=1 Tax=Diploptera punctata TaxID=6984 RepID=A0AAD8AEI6_DIPPU|nr:hypothetical protein L9F63_011874 [Diploptera punctata]